MKVFIEKTNKTLSISISRIAKTITVKELLSKLKINPTTVLVTRNNELVLEDEKLSDKDNIKILSVISGG